MWARGGQPLAREPERQGSLGSPTGETGSCATALSLARRHLCSLPSPLQDPKGAKTFTQELEKKWIKQARSQWHPILHCRLPSLKRI